MRINVANDEMLGRTTEKLQREIDLHCDFNNYLLEKIEKAGKEIERLHSIIEEVREIFKDYGTKEDIVDYSNYTITGGMLYKLLEILDKEKENE